ncbi:hypothetical protein SSPO_039180 [Streptomyces antimycoticus]|uniref:Uncharacterized protein n=1 Tax=Streptomyces antimycoticus TaxID=68175 RepID=A0A499ULC1_9ACTN|nr:hypothetical protein [Streptomyces antimycoticus]BBJ41200.1 hypothetical protein SSPO_039180 [Streptomyces antimycoticus]
MAVPHPPVYQEYYTRTPFQLFSRVGWKRLVAFRANESRVVRNNRVIVFWKVDPARLAAAVRAFAPHVQLRVHPVYRLRPGQGGGPGYGSGASIFDIMP